MKTKKFLLLCLLLGMATTQLSAQWPDPPKYNNGTGVVIVNRVLVWDESNLFYFWPDAPADLVSLSGTTHMNCQYYFKNTIPQFVTYQIYGEVRSDNPPYEVFKLFEYGTDYDNKGYSKLYLNFIGNKGSYYIIVATTVWGGSFNIDKFIYYKMGKH